MSGGESAGNCFAGTLLGLSARKSCDRFFETAFEQMTETGERHAAGAREFVARGQMISMNRGDEKERANAFVEIRFAATVGVELDASGEEFGGGFPGAPTVDGEIACGAVRGVDDVGDAERGG